MKNKPTIVYSDEDLLVVDKPPHMLAVPDRYNAKIQNVFLWLTGKYGKVMPVHRLDRNTSGLICFARTDSMFRHLSIMFEKRKVKKIYQALVNGIPDPPSDTIDKPIQKLEHKNLMKIATSGKPSQTMYEVVEVFHGFSLLDLTLITGRTHQIRVHLQSIGHPLLVDPQYGGKDDFRLSEIKPKYRGDRSEEKPLLKRTPLHASTLVLPMANGESLSLTSELPKDMRATINQFRKKLQKMANRQSYET